MDPAQRNRAERRFARQFEHLERTYPRLKRPLAALRERRWWMLRLPLGLLLIVGGFFGILPILGFWMIPLGLLILAVDLPMLRSPVAALSIWFRRRAEVWSWWLRDRILRRGRSRQGARPSSATERRTPPE